MLGVFLGVRFVTLRTIFDNPGRGDVVLDLFGSGVAGLALAGVVCSSGAAFVLAGDSIDSAPGTCACVDLAAWWESTADWGGLKAPRSQGISFPFRSPAFTGMSIPSQSDPVFDGGDGRCSAASSASIA